MQTYDVIMLAILGVSVLFGFLKGFAWQVASVAAFVVSYFVAANFSGQVASYFGMNNFVAMFLLFIGTSLGIWVGYGFVHKQIENMQLKSFDRQIGAVVGLGTGIILCLVVTFCAVMTSEGMGRRVVRSQSGKYITKVIQKLDGILPEDVRNKVEPYLDDLNNELIEAKSKSEQEPSQSIDDDTNETIREIEETLRQLNQ